MMSWLTSLFSWLFGSSDTTNTDAVAKIQAATVKLCGYLPYAETVAKLLSANPAVTAAAVVAERICGVVNPQMRLMGGEPTLDGVVIQGEFINVKKKGF
jgi:hypothetical protein